MTRKRTISSWIDRSLDRDGSITNGVRDDGPCGEWTMIAVSNPCDIDKTLAPAGYMVLHVMRTERVMNPLMDGVPTMRRVVTTKNIYILISGLRLQSTPDGFRLGTSLSKRVLFEYRDLTPERSRDHGSSPRIVG
jgi:hypothetical protein